MKTQEKLCLGDAFVYDYVLNGIAVAALSVSDKDSLIFYTATLTIQGFKHAG
jgi:hypothetical protein